MAWSPSGSIAVIGEQFVGDVEAEDFAEDEASA
jgi:hypothetical protein